MGRMQTLLNETKIDFSFDDYDIFDDLLSDPHVRIVGRKEDVLRVKDKVMAVLDAKVSQRIIQCVTLR